MTLTINFIERKIADTPSIENVFRQVAKGIEREGLESSFSKVPYSNGLLGLVGNLFNFRPVKADLYHVTGHVNYMVLALPRERSVLTIHDLGILQRRSGLRRWVIKKLYFDLPVRRAGAVTTISQATKDDLIRTTGIASDRIQVIENPIRDGLVGRSKPDFDPELPKLLQVGTAEHKNLDNLIKAVQGLECRLIVIGELSAKQAAMLDSSGIDYTNAVDLDDDAMATQYRNADILVFCSRFEGFGLPIIEAQASGTPVITSDRSPMKEVAGDGAVLVDPDVPAEIRAAIEKIATNSAMRGDLVARGTENVKRFAPQKIARDYISVYQELLGRHRTES